MKTFIVMELEPFYKKRRKRGKFCFKKIRLSFIKDYLSKIGFRLATFDEFRVWIADNLLTIDTNLGSISVFDEKEKWTYTFSGNAFEKKFVVADLPEWLQQGKNGIQQILMVKL